VSTAAYSVTSGAENPQDSADDQQDDPDGPQNADLRNEPDDEQNQSQNDHLKQLLIDADLPFQDE